MNKIAKFLSKWAFAIFLMMVAMLMIFAATCSLYVAKEHPFIGILGGVGSCMVLVIAVGLFCLEIKE